MFSPSPDGFSEGELRRGPTEAEAQTAVDVLRWANQYATNGPIFAFARQSLIDLLMDAEGK
jgi:hypothetical protein